MLIGAGSETTTNLLSGLLLTLAQRPDVFTQLREHPELIPAAMRNSCVLSHRCKASTAAPPATTPSVFTAANRDPRRFDDPTPLTSTATRPTTSPSAAASTTASARRCPVWKPAGSLANCFRESMPSVSIGDYRNLDNATGWCICPSNWWPPGGGRDPHGTTMSIAMTSESLENR